MRERLCPVCQIELKPQVHLGVTIDVCPACAGVWFDQDELVQLHQLDEEILPRIDHLYTPEVSSYDPPWERLCPICRVPLRSYNYLYTSNIRLDSCDQCGGVWVDNGELETMARVLRDARAEEVPPEAKAKMTLAEIEAQHQETMSRLEFWKGLFQFMRARPRFPI
ncbi:MAG: zf-TFIIB domain-containing protein [Fimbriimonadales bacterium]|nr:zf-TFIIB domain-containing protein [Fimbriimonadales bacterium]MCS7190911.1 zf-TFIIB domain-containing protein [Fimbriimonadales bacterium]